MENKLPEDIVHALNLLNSSESSNTQRKKVWLFSEGIFLLDDCLKQFPQYKQLIKNYKLAYTRTLITYLGNNKPDIIFDDWFSYVTMFCINVEEEIKQILKTNPELRIYFQ